MCSSGSIAHLAGGRLVSIPIYCSGRIHKVCSINICHHRRRGIPYVGGRQHGRHLQAGVRRIRAVAQARLHRYMIDYTLLKIGQIDAVIGDQRVVPGVFAQGTAVFAEDHDAV